MFKRLTALLVPVAAALVLVPAAFAAGGHYTFVGGSAFERSQVMQALSVSSFPWNIIPGTVVVHIKPLDVSEATPGAVWLDAGLLDAGVFSWGVIQHEFGHQVDFALLNPAMRLQLAAQLGGGSWWGDFAHEHGDFGSERFASELSWAYWPSAENCLRPVGQQDEAGHLAPALFRAALAALLPQAAVAPTYGNLPQLAPPLARKPASKALRRALTR